MGASDFKLTSIVRKNLVQLGIDTKSLNISVYNGIAYLKGEINKNSADIRKLKKKYYYSKKVLEKKLQKEYKHSLKNLDRSLKRSPGIKGVMYKLKKWEKKPGGGWIKTK